MSAEILTHVAAQPDFHRASLILAAYSATSSGVALWAALATCNWFWRALAAWAVVAALVPIRAYEPFWVFAASTLFTIAIAGFAKRLSMRRRPAVNPGQRPPARFTLVTVLLAIAIIGLWLAACVPMMRDYRPSSLWSWLAVSVALSAMTCSIGAAMFSSWPVALRLCFVVAPPILGLTVALNIEWLHEVWPWYSTILGHSALATGYLWGIAGVESWILLVVGTALFRMAQSTNGQRTFRWASRAILVSASLAGLLIVGPAYVKLAMMTPSRERIERGDEYAERLTAIAEEVKRLNPKWQALPKADTPTARTDEANRLATLHRESIGLLNDRRAAVESLRHASSNPHDGRFSLVPEARHLGYFLAEEAKSRRSEGDIDASAANSIGVLELGLLLYESERLADLLLGDALIGLAIVELAKDIDQMSQPNLTKSHTLLASYVSHIGEFEETMVRVWMYENDTHGWRGRLGSLYFENDGDKELDRFIKSCDERTLKRVQELKTKIATRLKVIDGRP